MLKQVDAEEHLNFFLENLKLAEPAELSLLTQEDWSAIKSQLKGVQFPKLKKYVVSLYPCHIGHSGLFFLFCFVLISFHFDFTYIIYSM